MKILVVATSLNQSSYSQVLARAAETMLRNLGAEVELLDLRQSTLALCNGQMGDRETIEPLAKKVAAADAIVLAVPIYNYDVNAATKNLVEHTGRAWANKVVGI